MKTIKKDKEIKRLTDKVSAKMVKSQSWQYCPKSKYKDKVKFYINETKEK